MLDKRQRPVDNTSASAFHGVLIVNRFLTACVTLFLSVLPVTLGSAFQCVTFTCCYLTLLSDRDKLSQDDGTSHHCHMGVAKKNQICRNPFLKAVDMTAKGHEDQIVFAVENKSVDQTGDLHNVKT
nr:hypothetical protein Iba_chr04dCG3000 [Ipomoea batatas]